MTIAHHKKSSIFAGICMTGMLLLGGSATANAAVSSSPEVASIGDTTEVRSNLSSMGVDAETQDSLIAKLQAGDQWDSMNGAAAVSTTKSVQSGVSTERRVYADGSVAISEFDIPTALEPGTFAAQSVEGCTPAGVAGETQFRGCLVKESNALISAEFEVDYLVGAGRAMIMKTGDSRVTVFFGNYSDKVVSIPQAEALIGVPAKAQLSFHFQAGAVNSDGFLYMRLTQAGEVSTSSAF